MTGPRWGVCRFGTVAIGSIMCAAGGAAADTATLELDRQRLVAWLTGEFSTWEQVREAEAGSDAADDAGVRWIESALVPMTVDGLSIPARYLEQWPGGREDEPYRQRVYTFALDEEADAVVMSIWRLADEVAVRGGHREPQRLEGVSMEGLERLAGCEIVWRLSGARIFGESSAEPCRVDSERWGEVTVTEELELDAERLRLAETAVDADGRVAWGGPDAAPALLRRVRHYTGWIAERGADGEWASARDLRLSDQGGVGRLTRADGSRLEVQLENLTRASSGTAVLKLTVSERPADGDATRLAYLWGEPAAERLGVDLGDVQAGFTRADDRGGRLDELAAWLTGSFSSAAQAEVDPDFFDIRLHMQPIWSDRTDGRWLYVEQAVATALDRPYRQRVYRLREVAPGLYESAVFSLPDPAAAVGAWKEPARLDAASPADLEPRTGCEILLRRRGSEFVGSTLGTLCPSELRGARYATSEVRITPEGMVSWDRGFDAGGTQVWGARTAGYVFDRLTDEPEPAATPATE